MKKTAHIIPHSHWDREWRYPIWQNRSMLVDFIDELLYILDNNPNYRQFIMDGQSVIIEDYLEMRPQNESKIKRYIAEGRIAVGPWYTLPDLYPLDGECLIRNLLRGFRVSESLGHNLKIAYTSFGWGQTAQFPQIYLGFGIDFCITAKRVTPKRAPESEFWWESPDGSRILTTRLGEGARAKFFVTTVVPAKYGMPNDSNWHIKWENTGLVYHKANVEDQRSEYFKFSHEDTLYTDTLKDNLNACWQATDDSVSDSNRLFLCGCDFSGAEPDLLRILDEGQPLVDFELVPSTIEDYIKALRFDLDGKPLKTLNGELREGPSASCSGNALSTRLYIKQLNKKAQNLLIRKAEPTASAMLMLGEEYDFDFAKKAWTYLLKAHPHDSINGVTQDRTAEDVVYHINQAIELADVFNQRSLRTLINHVDLTNFSTGDVLLMVYNPLPVVRSEVLSVVIDLPTELDAWDFDITDEKGNTVSWQKIAIDQLITTVQDINSRPAPFHVDRHTVYIDCQNIPAGGTKVYKVSKRNAIDRNFMCGTDIQRTKNGTEINVFDNILENEYLRVQVNSNGTFNLTNKQTGLTYSNMHFFEDTGEVGDYWINIRPNHNRKFNSIGQNADIWLQNNGSLSATIGIRIVMSLPSEGIREGDFFAVGSKRSEAVSPVTITSYLTLQKGSDRLDVRVELDNTVSDHRLRVVYPTGIKSDYTYAHGHFTVDKRPIVKRIDGEYMPDMQTLPMQTFVDLFDGKQGVSFIHNCLTEYEAKEDGSVYLTLLRGVKNSICTENRIQTYYPEQHGGQCLGHHTYEYAIYPHSEMWSNAKTMLHAQRFNCVPTVLQVNGGSAGDVAPGASIFAIDNTSVVMSALKRAEDRDSVIMRVYNPTEELQTFNLSLMRAPKKAYEVNLNEQRQNELDITKPITISKYKILTIELEFNE